MIPKTPVNPAETDRYRQMIENFTKNPEALNKTKAVIDHIIKYYDVNTYTLADIKRGSMFRDVETNQLWRYEGVVKPLEHSPFMYYVAEKAGLPVEVLPSIIYMKIRKVIIKNNITAPFEIDGTVISDTYDYETIISSRDFCLYFVAGKWKLVDEEEQKKLYTLAI
jgi:hypothetical protein